MFHFGISFYVFFFKFCSEISSFLFIFTEETIPALRVSEYLKSDGRQTLEEFTKSLERQITLLKNKQIRERKKTWLYKAEKNRAQTTTSVPFDLRRSTARVSPVVNAGFVGDEPALNENESVFDENEPSTSPRQSSLSSFRDYRRKKSAQVYPMQDQSSAEDHSSTQDHRSQTSLREHEESSV